MLYCICPVPVRRSASRSSMRMETDSVNNISQGILPGCIKHHSPGYSSRGCEENQPR